MDSLDWTHQILLFRSQRTNGSVEWDFSDGDSSDSDEVLRERKSSAKEVEYTLSHGTVWEQGTTVDGRSFEKLYNAK